MFKVDDGYRMEGFKFYRGNSNGDGVIMDFAGFWQQQYKEEVKIVTLFAADELALLSYKNTLRNTLHLKLYLPLMP